MFFPERIQGLRPSDRVLEIGPGASPHPRANVSLELRFESVDEAYNQRGRLELGEPDPRTVFYDGGKFPFKDGEFDYSICSHVVEHVQDVDFFISELTRVSRRGYLEYPLATYEYLYSIPEHLNFVYCDDGLVKHFRKADTSLSDFAAVQSILYTSLGLGYGMVVDQMPGVFIQGFEWSGSLASLQATSFAEVCPKREAEILKPLVASEWMNDNVIIKKAELKRLQDGLEPAWRSWI